MANNTGNPVGSTAAKDLSDNAENLDKFANGNDYEYADRLGRSRKSLKWIEDAALAIPAIDAAVRSEQQAERAISAKSDAEAARDAAQLSSGVYIDVAAGLASTSSGKFFSVPSSESTEYLILYQNAAGTALEVDRYPNAKAIEEIGIEGQNTAASGLAFAVTDEDGRRTWIEATPAGRPSQWSYQLIGEGLTAENSPALVEGAVIAVAAEIGFDEFNGDASELAFTITDDDGRRTELEVGLDGRLSQRVIDSIARRIGAATVVPPFPIDAWAIWGDSLVAGGWPAILAGLCSLPVYNGGWGGQGSSQIAARQGGVPARITVANNTIPASGTVTVTSALNNPLSDGGNRQGTLAGFPGVLSMAGGALTFTRTVAGGAVECPASSYFTPADGIAYADRHVAIWSGRNSFKGTAPAVIVASIRGMIDYLTPRVKRVIVMSIPPWVGEEYGQGFRTQLDNCNAAIAAAFPEYWLDISAWLRTVEAATAAGIALTADDLVDIANGLTPRSLRSDAGHLNAFGNTAVAYRVHQESQTRLCT